MQQIQYETNKVTSEENFFEALPVYNFLTSVKTFSKN